jgi:hypothetical protein
MPENHLPQIVRPASRGSKKDWVTVSGEIPPEMAEPWAKLIERRGVFQTDLIREAVGLLLKAEARKGRSPGRRATDVAA